MSSPLSDEHYLVVPTSLAATIGLEEATLVQVLGDIKRFSPVTAKVFTLPMEQLLAATPYWDETHLRALLTRLHQLGVLAVTFSGNNVHLEEPEETAPKATPTTKPISPSDNARALLDTSNTVKAQAPRSKPTTRSTPQAAPRPQPVTSSAVKPMMPDWQPRPSTYDALLHNHGIDRQFAAAQLDEFRIYWQDKGTTAFSWDSKFLRHVLHASRNKQAQAANIAQAVEAEETATTAALSTEWKPSQDCIDILVRDGVNLDFINTTIPEFVLYWRERGDNVKTWNSKFIGHVRRQWLRFTSAQVHDTEPHRIPNDWQPQQDTYDIIAMANIPQNFASEQVAGFVLFWRESNQLHKSWNAKFLQHVKYQWAKQNQITTNEITHQSATGKDTRGFVEKHSDTSWAEDL